MSPGRRAWGARCSVAAAFLAAYLGACRAPSANEPRSDRPRATSPSELFPDDLDFVVRIDATRVRQNPALLGVVRDLAKTRPSEVVVSIQAALADASAVWIGTRWMSDGFHGDGVVAIEGSAGDRLAPSGMDGTRRGVGDGPRDAVWRRVDMALPDVEVFDRPARQRGESTLQVAMGGRGLVLATAAEADAVLRVLRFGPDRDRLDPPARGLVSFAGRRDRGRRHAYLHVGKRCRPRHWAREESCGPACRGRWSPRNDGSFREVNGCWRLRAFARRGPFCMARGPALKYRLRLSLAGMRK